MANLQDAINQASETAGKIASENTESAVTTIDASVNNQGTAMTYGKPSLAMAAATTGVIPRNIPYLKVNEDGIKIGKDKTYITGFKGKILMTEDQGFMMKWTIRFGNPAQYFSTYDGAVCDKGGTWADAIAKAKSVDNKADPYMSVDVVITLTEAVKLKEETLPVGTKVAFNSSKTNFSEFQDFAAEVAKAGAMGEEVDVQIGCKEINHGGNTWGVATFELL